MSKEDEAPKLVGDHSLNLPYEDVPGEPIEATGAEVFDEAAVIASGVVCLALTVKHPDSGVPMAAVGFRFALPHGEFLPEIVLVCDEDEIRDLKRLVGQTVDGAINAARKARRRT